MFRKEAIEFQRQRLKGEISLAQPLSIHITISTIVLSFLLIVVFLTTSQYARKETVKGYLIPNKGVIKVYPLQVGTLDTLNVKDGDYVNKGDVLAKLVVSRTQLNGIDLSENVISILEKQIELLERDLVETKSLTKVEYKALQEKINELDNSINSANKQVALADKKLKIHMDEYNIYKELSKKQFISKLDIQKKEQEFILSQEVLEDAKINRFSLISQRNDVIRNLKSHPHETEIKITQIIRSQSEIERQLYETQNNYSFSIVAKESGIVSAIVSKEGELLTTNRPLLSIIPNNAELVAELLLPSRSAGFIKINDETRLRFDAFPYQRFGFIKGNVTHIDKSLLDENESNLPIRLNESVYRVRAKLSSQNIKAYGDSFPLKTGMLLEADIILENRSLFQWLLDPIYSLRGRIG